MRRERDAPDRVDTKNGKFVGMYGIDAIENAIPDCISITYLQVLDGISICTMHCKSKSSKSMPVNPCEP